MRSGNIYLPLEKHGEVLSSTTHLPCLTIPLPSLPFPLPRAGAQVPAGVCAGVTGDRLPEGSIMGAGRWALGRSQGSLVKAFSRPAVARSGSGVAPRWSKVGTALERAGIEPLVHSWFNMLVQCWITEMVRKIFFFWDLKCGMALVQSDRTVEVDSPARHRLQGAQRIMSAESGLHCQECQAPARALVICRCCQKQLCGKCCCKHAEVPYDEEISLRMERVACLRTMQSKRWEAHTVFSGKTPSVREFYESYRQK